MAQPNIHSVHVNAVLTNISVAYIQRQEMFIANRIFPMIPVDKKSDVYYTYTKNDWFRDEAQQRRDGEESAGSGYGLSTASYECKTWGIHKDIGDQTRENADSPINLDREATEFVTQRLLMRQAIQWASDYFTTSVWATDSTPTNLWSDFTASDPINDIETGKTTILSTTGFMANTLVLGYQTYVQLKQHPDLVDRLKYTNTVTGRTITPEMLAALFDIDRVLVASAVKATNVEGETAAYSFTHGKHALLCYVAPAPGLLTPSAGYTFAWRGVSGGMGQNIGINRFRMEHLKSDRVEGETSFANKVVASDLGYFFNGAVA